MRKRTAQSLKSKRGFANMPEERQKEIAARGGKAVDPKNRSFSQDRDLASAAGRKGGLNVANESRSFSQDRDLAREAGRKGGKASAEKKKAGAPAE